MRRADTEATFARSPTIFNQRTSFTLSPEIKTMQDTLSNVQRSFSLVVILNFLIIMAFREVRLVSIRVECTEGVSMLRSRSTVVYVEISMPVIGYEHSRRAGY